MAEYAYLHILYDAWKDVMAERPDDIEFRVLLDVCRCSPHGMRFPHHKLCSDPEFNPEALQLIHALHPRDGEPSTAEEEMCIHRQQQWQAEAASQVRPNGDVKIVATSGRMGAGKTYTAAAIKDLAASMGMSCSVESFGRKLKQFCSEYLEYRQLSSGDWELMPSDSSFSLKKYVYNKADAPACANDWEENGRVQLPPHKYIRESCLNIDPRVSSQRICEHLEHNLSIALQQCLDGDTALTARRVLQIVASVFRDLGGDDFWVSQVVPRLEGRAIVIDDLRFPNEARWVKRHGGYILHVDAPSSATQTEGAATQISGHVSETSMDVSMADAVLTNNHAGLDDKFVEALDRVGEYLSK